MKKDQYQEIENYMHECMKDSAHDQEHVYRVLYNALEIAEEESNVDYDVLICACLLHDIGRKEQFENPKLSHAIVGGEKAYRFLVAHNYDEEFAKKVSDCIQAHRFRASNPPQSIEAKILFDADKLDVTGAIGIARTLLYKGIVSEPLYTKQSDGKVSDGSQDTSPSFFQEYKYKLEKIYSKFYTTKGQRMADSRQAAAVSFYESMKAEVLSSYEHGSINLEAHMEENS